ncbi:MAG: hypothetical protein DCF29_15970 [Alphaproteobacteria bacterium]|nr:MAG: hypothetical protein DCF29_15970 [Alphaproteobacteria bacterium]
MKVFTWSDGFHAFTVATTSRPKALEAWGSRQDLFASGLARPLTEGPDYEAALASPGEVIERGLAVDVGKISKARRPARPADAARKAKARARREALERQLAQLDTAHAEAVAERGEALARIEAERARAEASYETRRKAIVADLRTARQDE